MKCIVHYFKDEKGNRVWSCNKYFTGLKSKIPMTSEKCYSAYCKGRRPQIVPLVEDMCHAKNCTALIAENRKLYCSHACQQRAKSQAYRDRKKINKSNSPELKKEKTELCAWKDCKSIVAPTRKKYCSFSCCNKNKREAERIRRKLRKNNVPPRN